MVVGKLFGRRVAAVSLSQPFCMSAAGQHRAIAGRFPKQSPRFQQAPAHPRHIAFAAATETSPTPNGVAFEDLFGFLESQYGLAERFVRGNLTELAEILGYHVGADPIIQYNDASILLEEIGAPPFTPEEFNEFKASRDETHEDTQNSFGRKTQNTLGEVHEDGSGDEELHEDDVLPFVKSGQNDLPEVTVDHPPRLFRAR